MTDSRPDTVPTVIVDDVFHAFLVAGLWCDVLTMTEDGEAEKSDTDATPDDVVNSGDAWGVVRDFLQGILDDDSPTAPAAWQHVDNNRDQVGHDLWLTANRHGAGFWDRGLGIVGEYLTAAAHPYGELTLFENSDGVVTFTH